MNVFNINRVSSGFALSYFLKWMIVFGKSRAKGEKHFTRLFGKMGLHFFLKSGN